MTCLSPEFPIPHLVKSNLREIKISQLVKVGKDEEDANNNLKEVMVLRSEQLNEAS
jgi:hypothetical protein